MRKSRRDLLPVAVILAVALTSAGVGLWLNRPIYFSSHSPTDLAVTGATLSSNGRVAFGLQNYGQTNISIITVQAQRGVGNNATYLGTLSLSSNNTVPAKGFLNLTVQFQGVSWSLGVAYSFTLTDFGAFQHPTYACLNGC